MEDYKDEIRSQIVLKEHHWQNIRVTNCYAFALGLDVPGKRNDYHYQLGDFYCHITGNSCKDVHSYNKKLLMDLDALELEPEEVDPNEPTTINITYDENGNTIINYSWLIAYFYSEQRGDYHFLRKTPSGIWWHKQGFDSSPDYHSTTGITVLRDPTERSIIWNYKYMKTYRLKLTKKQ